MFRSAPTPSGLVSWWAAESDPTDVLGLNPGTLQGGATFARGRVGQAFDFNGTSQGTWRCLIIPA